MQMLAESLNRTDPRVVLSIPPGGTLVEGQAHSPVGAEVETLKSGVRPFASDGSDASAVDASVQQMVSFVEHAEGPMSKNTERNATSEEDEVVRVRNTLALHQAREAGLLGPRKDARISGRISAVLLDAAKQRAHVGSDTELLEIALSRLVLEDDFGRKFVRRKGKVPKGVDLEF